MELVRKIDIHVHVKAVPGPHRLIGSRWPTPDELRAIYDRAGIDWGLQLSRQTPECMHDPIGSQDSLAVHAAHPGTLGHWFCDCDPRMGSNSADSDLGYYIDYWTERGASGVGELQSTIPILDPRVLNLFSALEKRRLPVTIHLGVPIGTYGLVDTLGLPGLEYLLQNFPHVTILGHSQRFWAEISGDLTEEQRGGYPSGPVAPGGRIPALLRKYPNLCGDLSAGSGANAIMRDPDFGYAFLDEFADRLFYGTDICAPDNTSMLKLIGFLDDAVQGGHITEAAYRRISRENALRLLNDPTRFLEG